MKQSNSSPTWSSPLTTSEASDSDGVNSSTARVFFGPVKSPEKKLIAREIARRAADPGGYSTPVRRSPRLSRLPPFQGQLKDAEDTERDVDGADDGGLQDEPQSPGEDTPENDVLQDEPSSVLASKIMRAFDNPSPPPQRRPYSGVNYTPGKDGLFPIVQITVPPSPFRTVNLFERLNQLAAPLDNASPLRYFGDPVSSSHSGTAAELPDVGNASEQDLSSPKSRIVSPVLNAMTSAPVEASTSPLITPPLPCHPLSGAPQCTLTHSQESVADCVRDSPLSLLSSLTQADPSPPGQQGSIDTKHRLSLADPPNSTAMLSPIERGDNGAQISRTVVADNTPTQDETVSPETKHKRKRKPADAEEGNASQPRLVSLSPKSTDLLAQLLPSSKLLSQKQQVLQGDTSPIPHISSSVPPLTTTHRPIIAPTPVRPKSILRSTSPLKLSSYPDDTSRTPARRVPVRDALANAPPLLQKAAQLALQEEHTGRLLRTQGQVFLPTVLHDPSRSPAKRVLMCDPILSPSRAGASMSAQLVQRARSASTEPRPLVPPTPRSHSVEPPPLAGQTSGIGKNKEYKSPKTGRLPYPLVPREKVGSRSTHPILEEKESEETGVGESTSQAVASNAVNKSQCRQPTPGSRIPRIGSKPYARPRSEGAGASKIPLQFKSLSRNPSSLAFLQSRSGRDHNSSNEAIRPNVHDTSRLKMSKRNHGPNVPATRLGSCPFAVHQVVPGMLDGKHATKSPLKTASEPRPPPSASPQKPTASIPSTRKTVSGMSSRLGETKAMMDDAERSRSLARCFGPLEQSIRPVDQSRSEISASASPSREFPNPPPANAFISATNEGDPDLAYGESRSSSRKSSRGLKPPSDVADLFSDAPQSGLTGRRPQARSDSDGFTRMSATALRTLTSSNTAKNQQTVTIFATELIKRDGPRPESPTVKIRTILQKQREEKGLQRKERAERRARRSEEGSVGNDMEWANNSDTRDDSREPTPTRHRRGPGDEEDYVTPERERPQKKLRFGDDVEEHERLKKQVKWYHGLSTEVYLDDIQPKPLPPSSYVITKGCLAPSSKNLRLDLLGNVVSDDRPFPELAEKHVVVKKYLYDNEVGLEPAAPSSRTTRSKSKKLKT